MNLLDTHFETLVSLETSIEDLYVLRFLLLLRSANHREILLEPAVAFCQEAFAPPRRDTFTLVPCASK